MPCAKTFDVGMAIAGEKMFRLLLTIHDFLIDFTHEQQRTRLRSR